MRPEEWVAVVGLAALIAYALLGGADFGGGIWDLLARGPRAAEEREAISHAMGPVWEANHVWLIFLVVLLFSCFPPAFSALSIAFFVPFHLVLVGIVLRGACFVFRSQAGREDPWHQAWGRLFGVASSLTPFVLGMCLGGISSGGLRTAGGQPAPEAAGAWLSPFSWSLGALSLAVCTYVAAVYLTLETRGEVQESFRRRALWAGAVMTACAVAVLFVAAFDAPRFLAAMLQPRSAPLFAAAGVAAALSAGSVAARRYGLGRLASGLLVALLVIGWGLGQQPFLVYPDLTLRAAASPDPSLWFVLWTLVPGAAVLVPSLWLLFKVFKSHPVADAAGG